MSTSNIPKFESYSEAEVRKVARAFVDALEARIDEADKTDVPTWQWTAKLKDWWSWTAPAEGVVVDGHAGKFERGPFVPMLEGLATPFRRHGECMLDLTHTRFEAYGSDYGTLAYWQRAYAPEATPELMLGLESESGRRGDPKVNTAAVLEDASKLVPVAARVKVVLFASNSSDERTTILEVAELMQKKDYTARPGRPVTWAWIDLPWNAWKVHPPSGWVGSTESGPLTQV